MLKSFGANPTRLAARLVDQGRLKKLGQGLFFAPRKSRFGEVPPTSRELLRAFLEDDYVVTGTEAWNALGLGTTAVSPVKLVYNRKRSGLFEFEGQRFQLRRVAFPINPSAEWFVVDLLENLQLANADALDVERHLASALRDRRFDVDRLREDARQYGTQRTRDLVERAAGAAARQ